MLNSGKFDNMHDRRTVEALPVESRISERGHDPSW
jgi:hypothetical protein